MRWKITARDILVTARTRSGRMLGAPVLRSATPDAAVVRQRGHGACGRLQATPPAGLAALSARERPLPRVREFASRDKLHRLFVRRRRAVRVSRAGRKVTVVFCWRDVGSSTSGEQLLCGCLSPAEPRGPRPGRVNFCLPTRRDCCIFWPLQRVDCEKHLVARTFRPTSLVLMAAPISRAVASA